MALLFRMADVRPKRFWCEGLLTPAIRVLAEPRPPHNKGFGRTTLRAAPVSSACGACSKARLCSRS
jgi:hypothetical protein